MTSQPHPLPVSMARYTRPEPARDVVNTVTITSERCLSTIVVSFRCMTLIYKGGIYGISNHSHAVAILKLPRFS